MQTQARRIEGSDGISLHLYTWLPDDPATAKGVIQLLHGQGEHAARYSHMAEHLTGKGFIVYADDHRGHGLTVFEQPVESAEEHRIPGHMADKDGWRKLLDDLGIIHGIIRDEQPDLPLGIVGHSLGSFMTQDLLIEDSSRWDAAVLMSSSGGPLTMRQRILEGIVWMQYFVKGARGPATWTDKLIMEELAKQVGMKESRSEWLSQDPDVVLDADNDPLMGFMTSSRHWIDFSTFVKSRTNPANLAKIRNEVPILLASGTNDPLGEQGAGVERLADSLRKAGVTGVDVKMYEGMRHELQNELVREQFFEDLAEWLDSKLVG